jgi:hypothetical protein
MRFPVWLRPANHLNGQVIAPILNIFLMLNISTGAVSRYNSGPGSIKMMQLLLVPAPEHWFLDKLQKNRLED